MISKLKQIHCMSITFNAAGNGKMENNGIQLALKIKKLFKNISKNDK